MPAVNVTFEQFRTAMLDQGYDEVLERRWEPGVALDTHTHPFEANALVVQGEMLLDVEGEGARRLLPGDRFHLQPNVPHSERYFDDGATYWVARKS